MAKLSENEELGVILASTITTSAATYIAAIPLPSEIKIPTVTFIATVNAAIITWWRVKVNNPEASIPTA